MRAADELPVSVLVVGGDARATARLLRSPTLDARGVRSCDQAVTLLGLSPADYDVVLLSPPASRPHLTTELRRLRESCRETLLFVLVGSASNAGLVELLDLGADDYVVDPVVPAVLAARIRARRRRRANEPRPVRRTGPHGDLVIDRSARRAFVRDHEIVLRVKEFDLLDTLASNAGRVVTRTTLMSVVWDEHWFRSTKTLDVTMVGLRRRLREAADLVDALVPEISTIRGVGYRMDPVHRRQPPVAYTVTSRPR